MTKEDQSVISLVPKLYFLKPRSDWWQQFIPLVLWYFISYHEICAKPGVCAFSLDLLFKQVTQHFRRWKFLRQICFPEDSCRYADPC